MCGRVLCSQVNGGMGIPLVFLLTDGAVQDEREICQMVERTGKACVG
jgi:hypothetical protein